MRFPDSNNFESKAGVVYVIGYADDASRTQAHKIGESKHNAEKRLKRSDTFCDPNRPLVVVKQLRFADRTRGEKRVHELLSDYRCRAEIGRKRAKEWFNCGWDIIEPALSQAYREEQLHIRAVKRAATFLRDVIPAVLSPAADTPVGAARVLQGIFNHRVRRADALKEVVYDAFAAPQRFGWLVTELASRGMRFQPVEKLVILRRKSPEFMRFMEQIGCTDASTTLKSTVAFDHDGNPVSLQDLKARCRLYDVQALLA